MNYAIKICHQCQQENIIFTESEQGVPNCSSCHTSLKYLRVVEIKGFVYVLSNRSMPGLVKIGLSTRPVAERVAELNKATAVPSPFKIEAYFACEDPALTEKLIHQKLHTCRMKNKEFFSASVLEAVKTLKEITKTEPYGFDESSESVRWNNSVFSQTEIEQSPTLQWLMNQKGS